MFLSWHLIARVIRLTELVSIDLLHLNALRLLVGKALTLITRALDRQVVVLSVMLGCAPVVTLTVSLASVGALLLDKDTLQRGSGTSVCYHDLLRVIQHLRVVDAT